MKNLSNTENELKKALLIKKACIGQNALSQSDCRIFKSPFSPEQVDETASFLYVDTNSQKLKFDQKFFGWACSGVANLLSEL